MRSKCFGLLHDDSHCVRLLLCLILLVCRHDNNKLSPEINSFMFLIKFNYVTAVMINVFLDSLESCLAYFVFSIQNQIQHESLVRLCDRCVVSPQDGHSVEEPESFLGGGVHAAPPHGLPFPLLSRHGWGHDRVTPASIIQLIWRPVCFTGCILGKKTYMRVQMFWEENTSLINKHGSQIDRLKVVLFPSHLPMTSDSLINPSSWNSPHLHQNQ